MQTSADTRLTYADFLRFPDDGKRHEIINGVHYVTPSPNFWHQRLLGRLHYRLADHFEHHPGRGEAYLSPLDVVLSNWDVVEPDLLVVLENQRHIETEQNIQGQPAIVVEILSPSTRRRDQTIKRDLYEAKGALEYWIVDPRGQSITTYRRAGDRFAQPQTIDAASAQHLTTELLPGFELALTEFFAERS